MKIPYNLRIKKEDDIDDAKEKNEKLINMVKKLQKEVSELRTSNRTLQLTFDKTEVYLKEVTNDKSIEEIIKTVKMDKPLKKPEKCPACKSALDKLQGRGFHVVTCTKCEYRNRVNEKE